MQSDIAPNSNILAIDEAVDGLTLDVFELTSDGLEVESLTGVGGFAGRTGCCCSTGSSTTCQQVSCVCFC